MKTIISRFRYFFLSTLLIFALSCSSEDGEDGAIGPQGMQGPAGVDGEDGEDGNANVVSVFVPDVAITVGRNTIMIPELTEDIFNNGFVIGYVTIAGNTNVWETIPVIVGGGDVALDITQIRVGELDLDATFNQTLDFRFILVAGTSSTGKTSKAAVRDELKNAGVDINDYQAVIDYFRSKK